MEELVRVISACVQNFASYKQLNFNFIDQGLTLIQGATGSGKSTLCDVIPWICWGKTAKGGTVDEVLSWPGTEIASGRIHIETKETAVIINRVRGPKPKDNDLYYMEVGGVPTRGKDIPDTQRIINTLLGLDCDLYLAGAYFHEFSQTAQFFTTTAKNRRTLCEQVVDLSLAVKLQTKLSTECKQAKEVVYKLQAKLLETQNKIECIQQFMERTKKASDGWAENQAAKYKILQAKYDSFEDDKRSAVNTYLASEKAFLSQAEKDPICSECGAVLIKGKKHTRHNPFSAKIDEVLSRENTYAEQMEALKQETNPHTTAPLLKDLEVNSTLLESVKTKIAKATTDLNDLEVLQDVATVYRRVSIMTTIDYIESQTNQLLTDHFDAEIRVTLSAEDADKLDVGITKDGNVCSYTQLSKGQRQLLKLCFGIAVMRGVANHHGLKFHQIFLDEFLDGLDEQMKAKAYKLLLTLSQEYDSIFVVEHSQAMKELFLNKYSVELVNGNSQIEKA